MLERQPPELLADHGLDEIIQNSRGQNKTHLRRIRDDLIEKYDEYIEAIPELEGLPQTAPSQEEIAALTSRFHSLRAAQSPRVDLRCPLCQVRHAGEWDHFLPRDHYPYYSIFGPNLIWTCSACNRKKGVGNIAPQRQVLNAYYDKVSENVELVCDWGFEDGQVFVVFELRENDGAENYIVEIARRHFCIFDLGKTLMSEANNEIIPFLEEIRENVERGADVEQFTAALIQRHLDDCRRHSREVNHWETALWQGAMESLDDIIALI